MKSLVTALTLLLTAISSSAFAASGPLTLTDKVRPGAAMTYADLLKLVYPDLKPDGTASYFSRTPRKNFGTNGTEDVLPVAPGGSSFTLGEQTFLTIGASHVLVLDRQSGLLAYFQVEPSPKLIDFVGVSQDQSVSLVTDFAPLEVKPGQSVFVTDNSHSNSGESFHIYNLFLTYPDRVELVYDGPMLYSFSPPAPPECRVDQRFIGLTALSTRHEGVADLKMAVKEEKFCVKGGKETSASVRSFDAPLTWQTSKYMGGSKPLYLLNKCRTEGKENCR